MTSQTNPYDAPTNWSRGELTLQAKMFAGAMGCFVLIGSAVTMGGLLFAILVLSAGRTLPSLIESGELLEPASQKLVLVFGGSIIVLTSLILASWVILRILKSQQRIAEVQFRRFELQADVLRMHSEVKTNKDAEQSVSRDFGQASGIDHSPRKRH